MGKVHNGGRGQEASKVCSRFLYQGAVVGETWAGTGGSVSSLQHTTKEPAGSVWNPSTATAGRWSDRWTHPMRTTSLRGYTDLMRYALGIGRNQTKYGAHSTKMLQKYITKKAASFLLPKAMLMYVSQPAEVCVLSGPRELFYRASPSLSLLKESSSDLPERRAHGLKRKFEH